MSCDSIDLSSNPHFQFINCMTIIEQMLDSLSQIPQHLSDLEETSNNMACT